MTEPITEKQEYIEIYGAREHNLKNIDIDIPRNKLVVITGLSGSGKSSLAFDTIFAEGQRRSARSLVRNLAYQDIVGQWSVASDRATFAAELEAAWAE